MDEIQLAIETFARGCAYLRSFFYPCLAERVGAVWVMRDAPRKRGDYRTEEWIAYGLRPAEVDRQARENTRGRYTICALVNGDGSDRATRDAYRELGYRLRTTEPMMIHDLSRIPQCTSPAKVLRVTTTEMAEQLAKLMGARHVLREQSADDSPLRQYVALVAGHMVGYTRSSMAGIATWCSSMYVAPEMRRQGIARSMLCQMLRDDRTSGAKASYLLASHVGAHLYPVVGYRQIGTLLVYSPATGPKATKGRH